MKVLPAAWRAAIISPWHRNTQSAASKENGAHTASTVCALQSYFGGDMWTLGRLGSGEGYCSQVGAMAQFYTAIPLNVGL